MTTTIELKPVTSHKIDLSLCTGCELCITICPAAILSKNEEKEILFQADKVELCIRCGHCMAMCETSAISIEGLSYETNFRPLPPTNWNHAAFMDFLLARRSVRIFKDNPVPVEVLQKIIDTVATAPFAVNPENVEITVVNDKKVIEKALPYMSKMYIQLAKILKVPFLSWLILRSMPKEVSNTLVNFIGPHVKKGLYDSSTGTDDITRNAPVLILFHAKKGAEEHTVDAHIYLTYSLLAAHSLGLGATAIGLIGPAVNQSKPLRRLFRIPEGNEVVESMIAGYPKFPFKRAIVRPRTKVTFIS
jgi:nitroreductase/NAD-dependent dihydropyrimidine dehydrogenase PreA subunit